jgi:hypothetical protein
MIGGFVATSYLIGTLVNPEIHVSSWEMAFALVVTVFGMHLAIPKEKIK